MRFPLRLLALALAACLAVAVPLLLPSAPASAASTVAASPLALGAEHASCKPGGPVHLEITGRELRGERLTLRYAVHAERDVQDVVVTAEADLGSALTRHQAARAARLSAGAKRSGTLDLRMDAPGARALLHATVTFVGGDDQGNEWLETVTVTHVEVIGEPEVQGVTPVLTEGEVSLSMPTRQL